MTESSNAINIPGQGGLFVVQAANRKDPRVVTTADFNKVDQCNPVAQGVKKSLLMREAGVSHR